VTPFDDDKTKKAILGAAQTIARAATNESGQLPALEDGDTLYSSPPSHPPQVSDASVALDDSGPRYQRTEMLGEGGMGQVWQVRDGRVGRGVAMKLMRLQGNDDGARARFLREARVQGQLEHPAVVPVYDLGRNAEGELFFTMKRIRGHTLSRIIERLAKGDAEVAERFSLRRLLTAFSQICLAIEYAHARGVLHRDLKPDNLMLGDHGEVYVLDWGVARVLRDDLVEGDDASLPPAEVLRAMSEQSNQTGLVGTPGYIAPEQLKGKAIGPTADVYALGAILFELLALRPLAGDGNALSRLERTLSGVDAAAVLAEREGVSPELIALVARATSGEPAQRLPTARAVQEAIERYLDGERDLELRRELAEKHLVAARQASAAGGDELEGHKRALRETGRALAIMPDHPDARRLILDLFAATPKTAPPEVEQAIEAERAHQSRITAKTGAVGMASMLLFLPILVLFGIRNWVGICIFTLMTVGAVAISAAASRQARRSSLFLYLVVFFNNLVFGLCAGMYGPLVLVPSMVITNTIAFALHLDGWPLRFAILSGCAAVAVPVVLSALGVTPASYVPSGEGMLLRPLWLSFPPGATIAFLTISTLIAIANGARSVALVRDALTKAERRNQMQRWQLQQLLPDESAEKR
jgi:serine/threonine-protein kinase